MNNFEILEEFEFKNDNYIIVKIPRKIFKKLFSTNNIQEIINLNEMIKKHYETSNIIYMTYIDFAQHIKYSSCIENFYQSEIFKYLADNTNTRPKVEVTINLENYKWINPPQEILSTYNNLSCL